EVLLGAAQRDNGIQRLWKALRHDVPSAEETAARRGIPAKGQPLAQIFKTQYRPHAGKLSYARVWRGALKAGAVLNDTTSDKGEIGDLAFPEPPPPVYALTVHAPDRKDDAKLSAALHKLVEEDPSLSIEQNAETGETVIHGQGEAH